MVPDQLLPIRGEVVPGSGHFQKLIALLALKHLLREHSAFCSVFAILYCCFHSFQTVPLSGALYGAHWRNDNSPCQARVQHSILRLMRNSPLMMIRNVWK